jgi:hypothetical protein
MWERYDVRRVGNGQKTFHHPTVGTMTLSHEVLEINGTGGARVTVYSAEPGSPDHDAVVLLDLHGADALDGTNSTNATNGRAVRKGADAGS